MVKKLTSNLGWKVLSLVLAFLLWLTVINIEDPQVSTTIRGITVEKLNESAITSKKWSIQYVEGDIVDVKVKGKRSQVYKLSANNIKAYVDMKNISVTGAVDIQLDLPNEVELVSKMPSSVSVQLESIIKKQFEIQYEKYGKVKAGYVDLSPIILPRTIELEAAESTIYKIDKVVVPVDVTGISSEITIAVTPRIYDYSGNELTGIRSDITQTQVRVPVEKSKILPINFTPLGEVAEGFSYQGFSLSETSVIVRGKEDLINALQEVAINKVSLDGLNKKTVVTVNLAKLLPDGVSLNQDKSVVEVTLDIEPIVTREFEFLPSEIKWEGIPEGKKVEIISTEPLKVLYKGVQSYINGLAKEELKPYIYIEEQSNGQHTIPVQWDEPQLIERVSPESQIVIRLSDEDNANN